MMRRVLRLMLVCGALAASSAHDAGAQTASRPDSSASQFPQLPLQRTEPRDDDKHEFLPLLLVLSVGAALAIGFAWRKKGGHGRRAPAHPADLRVEASTKLSPQASVHVVRWDDVQLLVACTPQSVTLLARKPDTTLDGERAG